MSRLIIDSPRSPSVAVTTTASPNSSPFHHASWKVNTRNSTPAAEQASTEPGEALPGLALRHDRRQRVAAEQHAGGVAAGVAADDGRDEGDAPGPRRRAGGPAARRTRRAAAGRARRARTTPRCRGCSRARRRRGARPRRPSTVTSSGRRTRPLGPRCQAAASMAALPTSSGSSVSRMPAVRSARVSSQQP